MWKSPLQFMEFVGSTSDSDSFKHIDITTQVEVPIGNHCGAFGAVRKHDVHKGIDLYCPVGTPVYSVEDGEITLIRQFTGEALGFPWWNDTWAINVEGDTGVVVYGEIKVQPYLKVGETVKQGTLLGWVQQVLKKDKGRPMSMLHFALHKRGVQSNGRWDIGDPQPCGLLDPTEHLLNASW